MKRPRVLVAGVFAGSLMAIAAIVYAQFGPLPFDAPVRYVSALPSAGWFPGQEVRIISGNPPSVVSWVWDSSDSDWERTDLKAGFEDAAIFDGDVTIAGAATITGALTQTGAITGSGAVTLGSNDADDITINGPITYNVLSETFYFQPFVVVEEDFTAAAVTDGAENFLILPGSQIGIIWYRFEQAFAGTLTPFTQAGGLDVSDGFVDLASTDGIDFTFGGDPTTAVYFDEDISLNAYCEASITIATVANIDELYFGWRLAGATLDANDVTADNTYAIFRVPDNAGDLDMESELNAGGTLNDDTGFTWANAETTILRVTIGADVVAYTRNGSIISGPNAVLNADNGDRMVCFLGLQNSAVGAVAGVVLNYVEIGIAQ